jgi:hypothetical protein
MAKKNRMAGDKKIDLTPDEHMITAQRNFDNPNYATDNQYGVDLSGIKYKDGIEDYFGDDASIGGNNVTDMLEAGFSADDIYNFSKARGLNYNKHGREYLQREGDYDIGYGSDQWGDVLGYPKDNDIEIIDAPEEIDLITDEPTVEYTPAPVTFSSAPVQTINTSPYPDESDFVPGLSGDGFDFDQTLNVNQDNDISNLVYGSNNNLTNYQDNSISNIASIGDGLYAQRNPMDFKNTFMQNLFN